MRILNISSLYPPYSVGGAEQGLKTISEAMVRMSHEVHVVTLAPPEYSLEEVQSGVTVHRVPLANLYYPWTSEAKRPSAAWRALWHSLDTSNQLMARRVAAIVKRINPDIVLTRNLQGFSTAVVPAIKRLGIPVVHVLHDFSLLCAQTNLYRNGRACGLRDARCRACQVLTAPRHAHLSHVDGVIGVSKAVLDMHVEHGLFQDCQRRVIYNALKPNVEILDAPRSRPDSEPVIFGYMGRVEQSKGIETLLRAAETLENNGCRFRIRVAGRAEPRYLESLQRRWPLESVEYVGYVDPAEFLSSLDCFVFPTEWLEALGNGVFEAFARGVPVIGSDAGGIPESIDQGFTGYIFKRGNPESLAQRMGLVLSGHAGNEEMAVAALSKAREYQPSLRAGEYVRFLERIRSTTRSEIAA